MIAWFTRNGVAANLLMLLLVFGGGYSVLTVKREMFPFFSLDTVVVRHLRKLKKRLLFASKRLLRGLTE